MMEFGGILGLIILIADVWAIVNIFGSSAYHRLQGDLDPGDPASASAWPDPLADLWSPQRRGPSSLTAKMAGVT